MAIYNVNKDTGDITETAGRYGSSNSVFYGTIAQWNALTTEQKKAYDHASIPDSLDGDVTFPASKTMMNSGGSVEAALDNIRCGVFENASSVSGYTNADITVPFGYTFSEPPVVTANILGVLNMTDMIGINIRSVSTTGFIARVRNVSSATLTPKISWIAILK